MTEQKVPAAGAGVTMHDRGSCRPGTIIEVSDGGTSFSFRLDDATATHRAVLGDDGVFREQDGMWKLDVGVRRACARRELPPPGARDVLDLAEAVERLEPFLLKTNWPPMTYLLIPNVLRSTDELLAELRAASASDNEQDRANKLLGRLEKLRNEFRRA